MRLKEIKTRLMKKSKFRRAFLRRDMSFEISQNIIEARVKRGLTQNELAKQLNTLQPSIARLESGLTLPSLRFLLKVAKVLNMELEAPRFIFSDAPRLVNTVSTHGEQDSLQESCISDPSTHMFNSAAINSSLLHTYEQSKK